MLETVDYNSHHYAHSIYLSNWFERYLFGAVQKYLDVRKGEAVLEVGCNRGAMVRRMQELGAHARGVDINQEAIRDGVTDGLQVMDATNLQFSDALFDRVYSLHTIEHIPDPKKALEEMGRVLKPGGRVVITYPVEPGFLRGISCLHHAVAVYKNPFLARKIHLHSFTPGKIRTLIERTALEYVQTPFFAVPFYPHQYLTVLEKKHANLT